MTQQLIVTTPGSATNAPAAGAIINANFAELYVPVAKTAAEIAAGVVPTNNSYAPGDLRRYGAVSGTDVTTALTSAVAQTNQVGGAPIYVSSALGTACTVSSGMTITRSTKIYGDSYYNSVLTASADITIFSFTIGCDGTTMQDIRLTGIGAVATNPGVLLTNCQYCIFNRVYIAFFGVGLRFSPGSGSSYLNSILQSKIISNNTINIDAQAKTHVLTLYQVTFGGSPCATGLKITDSIGVSVFGGDCESQTLCSVDIDCSVTTFMRTTIDSVDFENSSASAGDIRIGNTHLCRSVNVRGCEFAPAAGAAYGINPLNCDGLTVIGNTLNSGYATAFINRSGALTNFVSLGNGNEAAANPVNQVYTNYGTANAHPQSWQAPTFWDANYQSGAAFNQYDILATDMNVANGHWFAGADGINLASGSAPSAGALCYARALIVANSQGGNYAGAAYISGNVDMVSGWLALGQSATAPALTSGGTISATSASTSVSRVAPAAAVTGVILTAGVRPGQLVVVVNESAFSVAFAASGTSNVSTGVTTIIPAGCSQAFTWDSSTSLWYCYVPSLIAGASGGVNALQVGPGQLEVNNNGLPCFVLNSAGSNFGFIQNDASNRWSLATGTAQTVLGTACLAWTSNADLIGRGVAFCLRATSIEQRTTTTTLTNSTQLTYAIPAAGTYLFELMVFSYFTTAVTDGITANVNFSGSFTAVGSYLQGYLMNGTTTTTGIQPVEVSATVNNALTGLTMSTYGASVSSTTPAVHFIKGTLIATGSGTLAFAFAQATSGADTANLGVGSYMTVTQLS